MWRPTDGISSSRGAESIHLLVSSSFYGATQGNRLRNDVRLRTGPTAASTETIAESPAGSPIPSRKALALSSPRCRGSGVRPTLECLESRQMLAAQVAQNGLLQAICTNIALQAEGDNGPEAVSSVNRS